MEKTTFSAVLCRIRDLCLEPRVFLILVLAASAAMRFIAWGWTPVLERDSVAYINAAAVWAETGKYIIPQYPPLPCYIIKLLIQLGMAPETAARLYSLVPGSLVPLVAYAIAFETTRSVRIARYTAVFCIVHPTLFFFSAMPIRDSLYIRLAGVSLWLGFLAVRDRLTRLWVLFACSSALTWCCRHEGVELLPLTAVCLVFELLRKRYPWRQAAFHFLLFLVIMPTLWFFLSFAAGGAEPFEIQAVLIKEHFRDFIR